MSTINSPGALGAAVRGRRIALDLSQATLAARAGVSRPWLSHLETGKSTIELGLVMRVLDALGLQLELSIVGRTATGEGGRSPTDLDDLLERYSQR